MPLSDYAADFPAISSTVADSIARVLRQAILDGALSGGAILRQEDIAKQFGVSRVPIREALLKLEGQGLVETQPRRGVMVTTLSAPEFEEILEMRLALEALALELAAPRFTGQDLHAALEVVEQTRASAARLHGPSSRDELEARWGDLNWEFHRHLYSPANRPRLLKSIENLHLLFARHLRARVAGPQAAASDPAQWNAVLQEHHDMAMACGRHDAEAAKAILRRHIGEHGAKLVGRLRAAGDD